jgi:hypothetical protein
VTPLLQISVAQVVLGEIFASLRWNHRSAPSIDTKLLVGHGVGKRKVNNGFIARFPAFSSGNRIGHCELKRVNTTNDLEKVAARRCWVRHHERNGAVRLEDKDTADSQRHAFGVLVGFVENSELRRRFSLGITKEWELHFATSHNLNVFDPFGVRLGIVTGKATEFDTTLGELFGEVGGTTELGGAY